MIKTVKQRENVIGKGTIETLALAGDISDYGKKLGPTRHLSDPIQEEVLLFDNKDFLITNLETITKSDGTIRYIIEMKEL